MVEINRAADLAEGDNVMATPSLVCVWPLPRLRSIGNLSDCERVSAELGLPPAPDVRGPK